MITHVEVKKLFNGFASVRDYVLDRAVKRGSDLVIHYKDDTMRLSLERLKSKWQIHATKFKSKYGTGEYTLYDFKFQADNKPPQQELQGTLL